MRKPRKALPTSFNLDKETRSILREAAAKRGISVSALIRAVARNVDRIPLEL
jgi:predicted DNA-binding ribbon-helix-helix protein